MYKFTQRSWVGGRLDAELMGRQDLQKYYQGASEIKNFVVRRQGYLSKRRGSEFVCDFGTLMGQDEEGAPISIGKTKLIPLVHSRDEGYYVLLADRKAFVVGKKGIMLNSGEFTKDVLPYKSYDYMAEINKGEAEAAELKAQCYRNDATIIREGYHQYFAKLEDALKDVQDGETIYLNRSIYASSAVLINNGKTFTIDFNGSNLVQQGNAYVIDVSANTSVTITNTAKATSILSHSASRDIGVARVAGASLTIDGNIHLLSSGTSSQTNAQGVMAETDGVLHIKNGKITSGQSTTANAVKCTGGNTVVVDGGELTTKGEAFYLVEGVKATINGGFFNARLYSCFGGVINGGVWTTSGDGRAFYRNVTINGGRFKIGSNDFYDTNTIKIHRGEFCVPSTTATEFANALKLGGAIANDSDPRVIGGDTYYGYKQEGEEDYTYDFTPPPLPEPTWRADPRWQYDSSWAKNLPHYAITPYAASDIDSIDYCQSGDVVHIAHAQYPPAVLSFAIPRLTYKEIVFNGDAWARPRILSVENNKVNGGGATKTVRYICTYVKDGIESMPSLPFVVTYTLPWANGGAMKITCDKGANLDEPDYYNVYKSNGGEYGLIATIGMESKLILRPEVYDDNGTNTIVVASSILSEQGRVTTKHPIDYYLNTDIRGDVITEDYDLLDGTIPGPAGGGCGGIRFSGSANFDFGRASGTVVTGVLVGLDTYYVQTLFGSVTADGKTKLYKTGSFVECKLVCVDNDGVEWETPPLFQNVAGLEDYQFGETTFNKYRSWTLFGVSRSAYFDFTDALKAHYGNSSNFQVARIVISAYKNDSMTEKVDMAINSIQFRTTWGRSDVIEDDYISPDISLSPPQSESKFSGENDYPSCVGVYQQRLCYASSNNDPFTFWMSRVGDLYNFNVHESIREDDAITATLAATEFPEINHIVVNRDLMLFADSGEWQVSPVSGNTISYKTIQSKLQSAIGCARNLKPINIGDEIVFVKRAGETLLATRYNFASDGYESQDLSVLSQWIFKNNPIVQMAYRQNPDSTVECVLADGTLATLVYMKEHDVCAWSRHSLGGGWLAKGVVSNKSISNGSTEIMLLVERDGKTQMWRVRDDIPIRHNNKAIDHICLDGLREKADEEEIDAQAIEVSIAGKTYVGYTYEAVLETVRPEPQGSETIQFDFKNAKSAEVRILDSGDFSVNPVTARAEYAQRVTTGARIEGELISLRTRDCTVQLTGDNSGDGRIAVRSNTIFPLNILSISTNYEIQPLSGSAG